MMGGNPFLPLGNVPVLKRNPYVLYIKRFRDGERALGLSPRLTKRESMI